MENNKIMDKFLMFAAKLQGNRFMSAIKNAFTALLPLTIGGAFFTLILNVVLSTTTKGISLAKLPGMDWLGQLSPIFNAANYATTSIITLGFVVLASIELGRSHGRDELGVPVIGLSSFIALIATTAVVTAPESKEVVQVAGVIASKFTSATGLFLGMFASMISIEIYSRLANSGKLEISLPDSVPSNVVKSFNVLFPGIFTITFMAILGFVFEQLVGYSIFDAITVFIQTPLQGVLTGLPGYIVIFMMTTILWMFGIHGTQVLGPIYTASMLLALSENTEAVLNNLPAPNILNRAFISVFTIPTGAGITGGLLIAILLFSKREDYRTIAKISTVPAVFNINETMSFGLPIVLNPIFAIPFILSPAVSATIGYFLTKVGFATVLAYDVPWTTPPLLSAFLASGGHIPTVITQAIAISASILIYIPFVLLANKQMVMEEALVEEKKEI